MKRHDGWMCRDELADTPKGRVGFGGDEVAQLRAGRPLDRLASGRGRNRSRRFGSGDGVQAPLPGVGVRANAGGPAPSETRTRWQGPSGIAFPDGMPWKRPRTSPDPQLGGNHVTT